MSLLSVLLRGGLEKGRRDTLNPSHTKTKGLLATIASPTIRAGSHPRLHSLITPAAITPMSVFHFGFSFLIHPRPIHVVQAVAHRTLLRRLLSATTAKNARTLLLEKSNQRSKELNFVVRTNPTGDYWSRRRRMRGPSSLEISNQRQIVQNLALRNNPAGAYWSRRRRRAQHESYQNEREESNSLSESDSSHSSVSGQSPLHLLVLRVPIGLVVVQRFICPH